MSEWYHDPQEQTNETPRPDAWNTPETPTPSDETNVTPTEPDTAWQAPTAPAEEATPADKAAPEATPVQQPASEGYTPPVPPYTAPTSTPYATSYTPYTPPTPPYTTPPHAPYSSVPPMPPKPPKKKRSGAHVAVAILAVLCCVSLVVSGVLAAMLLSSDNEPSSKENATIVDREDNVINENAPSLQISDSTEFDDGGLSTSDIVNKNLDATVVLTMYTQQSASIYGYYGYGIGDSNELTEAGAASGIIMSEDGYIITNSHCVYDEETQTEYARIDVTLYDGRVYENAAIIGYDPTTDLAVIKIEETGLTAAEFGDSSAVALGDRVVTLGNSGGLQWSASQGILSGQARDVYEDTGYAIKCLQVDAIINPGSSGGPLWNIYGQVVGVNSAKIVLTGYEGLGFSIPINEAKPVIDDLVKYGYVTGRVSLGITGRTISSVGYEGFMIESINTNSALAGTAAQQGDIITHVNGVRVTSYSEMRSELTSYDVGDTITLTLLRLDRTNRSTEELTVQATLQESK